MNGGLGQIVRKERGATNVRQFAEVYGVSAATVSRVERGYMPDMVTFAFLCEGMHLSKAAIRGIIQGIAMEQDL